MVKNVEHSLSILNLAAFRSSSEEYTGLSCAVEENRVVVTSQEGTLNKDRWTAELSRFLDRTREGDLLLVCSTHFVLRRIGIVQSVVNERAGTRWFPRSSQISLRWIEELIPRVSRKRFLSPERFVRPIREDRIAKWLGAILLESIPKDKYPELNWAITLRSAVIAEAFEEATFITPRAKAAVVEVGDGGGIVELCYGTNRGHTGKDLFRNLYSDDISSLKTGICWVSVPPGHRRGHLEKASWWGIRLPEKPTKHFMIVGIEELSYPAFSKTLSTRLKTHPRSEALLFVHGFNCSFESAALRTAQIIYDISFQGTGAFFSWPSSPGKLRSYSHDMQLARNSVPDLEEFVTLVLNVPGIEKLHIIAHSLGSYVATLTIDRLSVNHSISGLLHILRQLVLCAPDVDQNEFERQYLPHLAQVGTRRTLYANDADRAISLSEWIRMGLKRLGDAGINLFVRASIDTVDATTVATDMLGHGYFASNQKLIEDLHLVTDQELDPGARRLLERTHANGLKYWEIP